MLGLVTVILSVVRGPTDAELERRARMSLNAVRGCWPAGMTREGPEVAHGLTRDRPGVDAALPLLEVGRSAA